MSGLVLKLRAHEEVLVNGAIMRNGDRNVRILVKSPNANILRLSEALREDEVQTPVTELCYLAQRVVAGQAEEAEAAPELAAGIDRVRSALEGHPATSHLDDALTALREKKFYGAFRALKRLVPVEADLLARV